MEWIKDNYSISTDKTKLDIKIIHQFLSNSYWSKGITEVVIKKSIKNCLTFGLYKNDKQIGFAKMITDRATFAYLADVFVIEEHQGKGLGKWFIQCMLSHPDLQGLRRIMLATKDAHALYEQFGFKSLATPDRYMEIWNPNVYQ